ncbi:MAG: DsbA family protein [Patescibacteria group bacterium]|nr:DsbA family protein [Patescibacteria group bacterium]
MKMEEESGVSKKHPWYLNVWVILGLILVAFVFFGLSQFFYKTYSYYQVIKSGQPQSSFMPIAEQTAEMKVKSMMAEKERERVRRVVKSKDGDPFAGPVDAKYEIVIFEDFGCPYCKMAQATIADLKKLRPDIKISYRDFPITELHPDAMIAAQASRCMWQQGDINKYNRYREVLYAHQNEFDLDSVKIYAADVGADRTAFNLCMQQQGIEIRINQSILDAENAGVTATPTFFVDGIKVEGVHEASKMLELLK